jgi:hypothetical protein
MRTALALAVALMVAAVFGCGSVSPNGGSAGSAGARAGAGGGTAGSGGQATAGAGGGGTAGAGGGTAGAGGAAGGSAGTAGGADACHKDADCPPIQCLVAPCPENLCVLGGDGWHHCTLRAHYTLDSCTNNPTGSPCCKSDADCTAKPHGICVPFSVGYCGGVAPPPINNCRYDTCQSDADCTAMPNGVCTAGYPRGCGYGPCRKNADCTKGPGGVCVLESVGGYCPYDAIFCRYSADPCRSNADCKGNALAACVPKADAQGTMCMTQPPPPP